MNRNWAFQVYSQCQVFFFSLRVAFFIFILFFHEIDFHVVIQYRFLSFRFLSIRWMEDLNEKMSTDHKCCLIYANFFFIPHSKRNLNLIMSFMVFSFLNPDPFERDILQALTKGWWISFHSFFHSFTSILLFNLSIWCEFSSLFLFSDHDYCHGKHDNV